MIDSFTGMNEKGILTNMYTIFMPWTSDWNYIHTGRLLWGARMPNPAFDADQILVRGELVYMGERFVLLDVAISFKCWIFGAADGV